jgi:hypothetical protein
MWIAIGHEPTYLFGTCSSVSLCVLGARYVQTSSIRWKHNIELIDSPLERIEQIRGVYFDRDKEHGDHHDVDMIAE